MGTVFLSIWKGLLIAALLILAFAVLFLLNALRIAIAAYVRMPIRKQYQTISERESFVPISRIPASAGIVLVATEDIRFYSHPGFSVASILIAMRKNRMKKSKKREKRGGSTITQQLVKNIYFTPRKTYTRKLAELFLAVWVELRLSKRQILELYLNVVYFGKGNYGLGPASRFYFDALPCDLSVNQMISLLCILPNPERYNPLHDPELFHKAKEITLKRLVKYQCITSEYAQTLSVMPWNAYSGRDETVIVRSYLKKSPCYRENLTSEDPKYSRFHNDGPSGLMLHSAGCARPEAYGFLKQWNRRSFADACVHAFIDANDGAVYQTLPWHFRAWHCGGTGNNTHLGIEMCEPDCIRYGNGAAFEVIEPETAERYARRTYEAAVKLFAMLCLTYHLDASSIVSHSEGCALGIASDHKDPEHLWQGLGMECSMDTFRADVRARMEGEPLQIIHGPPYKTKYPPLRRIKAFLYMS